MSDVPDTDPRDAEVLAARRVPRDPWRTDQTWVRFSLHVCHRYRHRPAQATSLQVCIGQLVSKGQTAEQRAQAPCPVAYSSVCLSPPWRAWRQHDAVAPSAPQDGADGLAARTQESGIGPSRMREEPAPVLVQAYGASAQPHAAWREVDATVNDDSMRPHDSPKALQAEAGWMRKCRGVMVTTTPAALTGTEAKRFWADLAGRREVSAAAHNQAFNALLLLCRHVFTQERGDHSDTPRATRSPDIPTALSQQEGAWLLAEVKAPDA